MKSTAVVFDLEFTSWEGSLATNWSRPFEFKELVQIGAIKLDAASLTVVEEFEILVRPRVNPLLSSYFTALTGITNEAIERRGVDFAVGYRAFLDFAGGASTWAFGRDDLIFADNLKLYGLAMPVLPYTNVIPWFGDNGVDLVGKHACDVALSAGATFAGRAHDALSDAHAVALGIVTVVRRGAPNPFETEGAAPHRQGRDQPQH
jgi:inhibitor of KinA sporulation pathway (predicted exonuclease)